MDLFSLRDTASLEALLHKARGDIQAAKENAANVAAATKAAIADAEARASAAELEAAQGVLASTVSQARRAGMDVSDDDMQLLTGTAAAVVAGCLAAAGAAVTPESVSHAALVDAILVAAATYKANMEVKHQPGPTPVEKAAAAAVEEATSLSHQLSDIRHRREGLIRREAEVRQDLANAKQVEKESAARWNGLQSQFGAVRTEAGNRLKQEETALQVLREEVQRMKTVAANAKALAEGKAGEMLSHHIAAVKQQERDKYAVQVAEVRSRCSARLAEGVQRVNDAMTTWLRDLVSDACREVQAELGAKAAEAAAARQAVVRARRAIAKLIIEIQEARRRGPMPVSSSSPSPSKRQPQHQVAVAGSIDDGAVAAAGPSSFVSPRTTGRSTPHTPVYTRSAAKQLAASSASAAAAAASSPALHTVKAALHVISASAAADASSSSNGSSAGWMATLRGRVKAGAPPAAVAVGGGVASSPSGAAAAVSPVRSSASAINGLASPSHSSFHHHHHQQQDLVYGLLAAASTDGGYSAASSPRKQQHSVPRLASSTSSSSLDHESAYRRLVDAWETAGVTGEDRLAWMAALEQRLPFSRHLADMWRAAAVAVAFSERLEAAAEAKITSMGKMAVDAGAIDAALASSPAAKAVAVAARRAEAAANAAAASQATVPSSFATAAAGASIPILSSPPPSKRGSNNNNTSPIGGSQASKASPPVQRRLDPDVIAAQATAIPTKPAADAASSSPIRGAVLAKLLRPTFSSATKELKPSPRANEVLASPRNLPDKGISRRMSREEVDLAEIEAHASAARTRQQQQQPRGGEGGSGPSSLGIAGLSAPRSARDPLVPHTDDGIKVATSLSARAQLDPLTAKRIAASEISGEVRRAVRVAGADAEVAASHAIASVLPVAVSSPMRSLSSSSASAAGGGGAAVHVHVRSPGGAMAHHHLVPGLGPLGSPFLDRLSRPTVSSSVREQTTARATAATAVSKIEAAAMGEAGAFTIGNEVKRNVHREMVAQARMVYGVPAHAVAGPAKPATATSTVGGLAPRQRSSSVGRPVHAVPASSSSSAGASAHAAGGRGRRNSASGGMPSPAPSISTRGRAASVSGAGNAAAAAAAAAAGANKKRLGGLPAEIVRNPFTTPTPAARKSAAAAAAGGSVPGSASKPRAGAAASVPSSAHRAPATASKQRADTHHSMAQGVELAPAPPHGTTAGQLMSPESSSSSSSSAAVGSSSGQSMTMLPTPSSPVTMLGSLSDQSLTAAAVAVAASVSEVVGMSIGAPAMESSTSSSNNGGDGMMISELDVAMAARMEAALATAALAVNRSPM